MYIYIYIYIHTYTNIFVDIFVDTFLCLQLYTNIQLCYSKVWKCDWLLPRMAISICAIYVSL